MATKAKITVSIDEEIVNLLQITEKNKKGGVSSWLNDAAKRKIRTLRKTEQKKQAMCTKPSEKGGQS